MDKVTRIAEDLITNLRRIASRLDEQEGGTGNRQEIEELVGMVRGTLEEDMVDQEELRTWALSAEFKLGLYQEYRKSKLHLN